MFNWLQNKDWKNSQAHLLLLSKFRNGDSPETYRKAENWESVLKEKPFQAIEKFLKDGALELSRLQELVAYKFKASELKSLLSEKKLKVTGSKEELIQRLIENDEKLMRESTNDLFLYRCTEDGIQLVERYIENEKAKRNNAKNITFELLIKKDLSGAARVATDYEASQIFPRGIGIDWKNYDSDLSAELRTIFEGVPEILKGIEKEKIAELRLATAMGILWGTNVKDWLPDGFQTGIHLDPDVASRMFIFYSSHIRNMQSYRLSSTKTVEVIGSEQNSCAECKKINGKKYKLENVPELPYAKCTCVMGCRCTTAAGNYR